MTVDRRIGLIATAVLLVAAMVVSASCDSSRRGERAENIGDNTPVDEWVPVALARSDDEPVRIMAYLPDCEWLLFKGMFVLDITGANQEELANVDFFDAASSEPFFDLFADGNAFVWMMSLGTASRVVSMNIGQTSTIAEIDQGDVHEGVAYRPPQSDATLQLSMHFDGVAEWKEVRTEEGLPLELWHSSAFDIAELPTDYTTVFVDGEVVTLDQFQAASEGWCNSMGTDPISIGATKRSQSAVGDGITPSVA